VLYANHRFMCGPSCYMRTIVLYADYCVICGPSCYMRTIVLYADHRVICGPSCYMRSIVYRNVVMWRTTVQRSHSFTIYIPILCVLLLLLLSALYMAVFVQPADGRHSDRTLQLYVTTQLCWTDWISATARLWAITQRAVVIYYRRFGTTYRSHIQRSRIKARNYHYSLRNNPEERSSHILRNNPEERSSHILRNNPEERSSHIFRGGSLKRLNNVWNFLLKNTSVWTVLTL
jgi:hypothetical protein